MYVGGAERDREGASWEKGENAVSQLSHKRPARSALASRQHANSPILALCHQLLEALGDTILEPALAVRVLGSLRARGELGLGRDLRGGRRVLELGLAVDNVGIASGSLPDFGLGNDEEDVLGPSEGHSLDAGDSLEAEALERFTGLSLGSRLDVDDGAGGVLRVLESQVFDRHGACVGWMWGVGGCV